MSLTKAQIVENIQDQTGLTKIKATETVETLLEIIKSSGFLIYLESSPEETYRRLRFKRDRPALLFDGVEEPTKEEFIDKINSLLRKRIAYYNQADLKVNTDNCRVGKTIDKLSNIIKKEFYGENNKR